MELIKNKIFWLIIILSFLVIAGFTLANNYPLFLLSGFVFIIVIMLFIKYPIWGIYLMAILYPFTYFELFYQDLDIPYVDLVALLLFIAWGLRTLYLYLEKGEKLSRRNFPALIFMALYVLANFLSLLNVDREQLALAIKFVFRPIIFFYLMYIILPYNIIDSLKKLFTVFKIMFVLGLSLSLMGIWSIIITPAAQIKRAMPTAIFNIYPLGTNHNLLAEVFVCIIPIALILYWYEKDTFWKNVYLIGTIIMVGLNLLTLSRAGWLALALQLLVLAVLKYKKEVKNILTSYLPYLGLILMAPIIYLMYRLFNSTLMSSSNLNRLNLIELSFALFKNHPLFGNGSGTFIPALSQIKWYLALTAVKLGAIKIKTA
ncbi:MAG: O-antigen ligase family protein [Candidatus Parcubacteria bacterium]|nr:O-antigen ligase family protein [Candidatus Parcubacteria bacterium]